MTPKSESRIRQAILWTTVLLLLGIGALVGHRYFTIQRLEASGVKLDDWVGWGVTLEEKIRDYYDGTFSDLPLTASFSGCYPTEAVVVDQNYKRVFPDAYSLGRALRSIGEVEDLYLYLGSDQAGFLDGFGPSDRLTFIFSVVHGFDDNALAKLAQFPNLQHIILSTPILKGSGLPDRGKLQKLTTGDSAADTSLIDVLLKCPELRVIHVESPNIDLYKAKQLTSLPKVEWIEISNIETGDVFEWKRPSRLAPAP